MFEKRDELMVSPSGGKPTTRPAFFLKPSCLVYGPELAPLSLPSFSSSESLKNKVIFNGFPEPQPKWGKWIKRMMKSDTGCYSVWVEAGVEKSILASVYNIPRRDELLYGLAKRWCPQTNTFFFAWGEATLTLEDMKVLGGFSVLGAPFSLPLESQQLLKIQQLEKARQDLKSSSSCNRAQLSQWLDHFMGSDKKEHLAFLVYWLSRFVIPGKHYGCVNKEVFPIAIHLAQGRRIGLASLVLTSIYSDLTSLRRAIDSSPRQIQINDLCLVAPFFLVQAWAWERILELQPKPRLLTRSDPRLARWHGAEVSASINIEQVLASTRTNFLWRPYTIAINNWEVPEFYIQKGGWHTRVKGELASFVCCMRDCVLEGLSGIECYLPSRVAMQFAIDQDVPGSTLPTEPLTSQGIKNVKVYVPPRLFESDVTLKYSQWWESLGIETLEAIKPFITKERTPRTTAMRSTNDGAPESTQSNT